MKEDKTGVVLMAYGGPRDLEEVPAFLDAVLGKGRLSDAQLHEIKERYRAIGGGSPILEITRRQAEALGRRLSEMGRPWPVAVGMRYSEPKVAGACERLVEEGCGRLIGLALAPHASPASTDAYRKALLASFKGREDCPEVKMVDGWHTSPGFLQAWAGSVRQAWGGLSSRERAKAMLVFTVHSIPVAVAAGSPYEAQVLETIEGVMELLGPLPWKLGWQSQGIRGGEWLMPDVPQTFAAVKAEGFETVVVVPVGFVADHVETLYDLDIDARRIAGEMGLGFRRAASLNDSPEFIGALASALIASEEGPP